MDQMDRSEKAPCGLPVASQMAMVTVTVVARPTAKVLSWSMLLTMTGRLCRFCASCFKVFIYRFCIVVLLVCYNVLLGNIQVKPYRNLLNT